MEKLIKQALDEAIKLLDKQTPETKRMIKEVEIEDVKPLDLPVFMEKNNIPSNANISTTGDEEGAFGCSRACLYWDIEVPTTDKDKLIFRKKRFDAIAWKKVYDLLLADGYKRVGFNSGLLKEFDNTTMYEMYLNKDFDKIIRRYSLSFKKEGA